VRIAVQYLTAASVAMAFFLPSPARAADTADVEFRLLAANGKPVIVQMPLLAATPPLDIAAACVKVAAHNETARKLSQLPENARDDDDPAREILENAEAGCSDAARRDFKFYDQLGDLLTDPSGTEPVTRLFLDQMTAAMREALRVATNLDDMQMELDGIDTRVPFLADRLGDPTPFLIGVEATATLATLCAGAPAECRASADRHRGLDLMHAGRWLGQQDLLGAAVEAFRNALPAVRLHSQDWINLHAYVGSALSYISELEPERRQSLLEQALAEYDAAERAIDRTTDGMQGPIEVNECSIREPLAALTGDREMLTRAIEQCRYGVEFYEKVKDGINQAGAHYNLASAFRDLARWDRDQEAARHAVEHSRLELYDSAGAALSVAFARVGLATSLVAASRLADRDAARPLFDEARNHLDLAEPVLRQANATHYLEQLATVRRDLPAP
jgi:tetratricopeptide (TPR) repeat protein